MHNGRFGSREHRQISAELARDLTEQDREQRVRNTWQSFPDSREEGARDRPLDVGPPPAPEESPREILNRDTGETVPAMTVPNLRTDQLNGGRGHILDEAIGRTIGTRGGIVGARASMDRVLEAAQVDYHSFEGNAPTPSSDHNGHEELLTAIALWGPHRLLQQSRIDRDLQKAQREYYSSSEDPVTRLLVRSAQETAARSQWRNGLVEPGLPMHLQAPTRIALNSHQYTGRECRDYYSIPVHPSLMRHNIGFRLGQAMWKDAAERDCTVRLYLNVGIAPDGRRYQRDEFSGWYGYVRGSRRWSRDPHGGVRIFPQQQR